MNSERYKEIAAKFPKLRVAVLGDFCLDRYLEIDPAKREISLETRLPIYNVVKVRAQPGGAGTILNNLSALGIGEIYPIGFCGDDGEGYELQRCLKALPGVIPKTFFQTAQRRTFVYCKPLIVQAGTRPVELNRFDSKNWTATPAMVEGKLMDSLFKIAPEIDVLIILDQTDSPGTGVVTRKILGAVQTLIKTQPNLLVIGDSRRNLKNFPPVVVKVNQAELGASAGLRGKLDFAGVKKIGSALAATNRKPVYVTLAEAGIVGFGPNGEIEHVPALPTRGMLDIVGAGDAVTANLATTLAAGGTMREAIEVATAAASVVIHQLGTTGTAGVKNIAELIAQLPREETTPPTSPAPAAA